MDTPFAQYITTLLYESGTLMMHYYGSAIETRQKSDPAQVVTVVDLASERLITAKISERFPNHSIIAEESGFVDKKSEYAWIIDPIDGTSNFAKGLPWFGVMIAVLYKWEPIACGIYLPVTDEMYCAAEGKGAYRNGKKFIVSTEGVLKDSLVCFHCDPPTDPDEQHTIATIFTSLVPRVRNLRSTNSAVDYAYVAEGKIGGLISFSMKIWDVVPVSFLAKEAGCRVTDLAGNDLEYRVSQKSYLKNYQAVIGMPQVHHALLELIH